MKCEKLSELLLDRLLVAQNYHLVAQDIVHVRLYCIHVLANGDLVFLVLIQVRIEPCSQVMDLALECRRRTDRVLLM